ncbi:potassium-transporting ATPase subunit KdpC [Shimwellia pseudoproteus]|uniref:potassium-transporting ATPase subunit KdpC n=1 Tax=Shimwellia pseudoproteus TaxID=570012 RepID=UPI0018ED1FE2|nr:potassium-transporting ATPase subunit KdpC [Shimwellia pseudoproteus]MBJ3814508.1 potassium-transporting ATPase subunit KdpC [Shimwellia pseudoproteus]
MAMLRPAVLLLLILALLTGGAYPLVTSLLGQWWFPAQAAGSLIDQQGQVRGSRLLGQAFTRADYFHGRPPVNEKTPYDPLASGGSNLAGSNPQLDLRVAGEIARLRRENPQATPRVPVELVTTSASGLDADISPRAARWQAPRVAQARGLPLATVNTVISRLTRTPLPAFIGQPVVNVVQLNMALDALRHPE